MTSLDIGTPEGELKDWAFRDFVRSYSDTDRRRVKESRTDYWYGYRQGLIDAKAFERFQVPPE